MTYRRVVNINAELVDSLLIMGLDKTIRNLPTMSNNLKNFDMVDGGKKHFEMYATFKMYTIIRKVKSFISVDVNQLLMLCIEILNGHALCAVKKSVKHIAHRLQSGIIVTWSGIDKRIRWS